MACLRSDLNSYRTEFYSLIRRATSATYRSRTRLSWAVALVRLKYYRRQQ